MDVKKRLEIDKTDLSGEMAQQASMFVYAAELECKAGMEYDTYKVQHNNLVAAVDEEIRVASAGKKITEKAIEKQIERDDRVWESNKRLIQLKTNHKMMANLRAAWEQRASMLKAMAYKEQSELNALLSDKIKAENPHLRAVGD